MYLSYICTNQLFSVTSFTPTPLICRPPSGPTQLRDLSVVEPRPSRPRSHAELVDLVAVAVSGSPPPPSLWVEARCRRPPSKQSSSALPIHATSVGHGSIGVSRTRVYAFVVHAPCASPDSASARARWPWNTGGAPRGPRARRTQHRRGGPRCSGMSNWGEVVLQSWALLACRKWGRKRSRAAAAPAAWDRGRRNELGFSPPRRFRPFKWRADAVCCRIRSTAAIETGRARGDEMGRIGGPAVSYWASFS
jgi:hypothetical protein